MEHLCYLLACLVLACVVIESQGTFPYLSLGSSNYTNHSYLDFDRIGEVSLNQLHCHTDLATCCNNDAGDHRGNWYYPNGTQIPFGSSTLYLRRQSGSVYISRETNLPAVTSAASGIYRCTIETNAVHSPDGSNTAGETIYIGIYTSSGGNLHIEGGIDFEEFTGPDGETSHYTLTCTSTGGPATNVTWRRNSVDVITGADSVLNDPETAQYTHTLTVPGRIEGVYVCIVSNDKFSTVIEHLTVTAPEPPTDLQVIQNGMNSVLASWIPSSDGDTTLTTGYTIRLAPLQDGLQLVTATAAASETSTTILGLTVGATYSVTIVANSNTLSSNVTGPENVTIETVEVTVSATPTSPIMIGDSVSLTCSAELPNGVVGPPSFQWDGPEHDSLGSTLSINAIELGQAGQYTCTVIISFFNISESIDVSVQVEAPQPMIEGSRSSPLYEGTAYNLTCSHQLDSMAVSGSTVEWMANGGAVDASTTRISVTDDGLIFSPLATSDSGNYVCTLTLTAREFVVILNPQQQSNPVEVTVEELPLPEVTTTSDAQQSIGDELALNCAVSVVPHLVVQPSLQWEAGSGDTLATGTGLSLSLNLAIDKTSAGGLYTCRVAIEDTDIGLSATGESQTRLTIQMPRPGVVINPDRTGTLYAGSNLTLLCVVTFDPTVVDTPTDAIITWSGPGTIPGEWNGVSDTTTNNLEFSSSLSITPLARDRDSGEYTCSAMSIVSDDILPTHGSNSIMLEITSPPPLTVSIEAQGLLLTGQSYAFQCTADVVADLLPSLGLELLAPNGTSLASLISHDSSTVQYTLSSLEKSDRGEYMCRAVLAIPGSGIDSSTTDSTFITVEDAYPVQDVAVASSSSSELELTWDPPLLGSNLTTAFVLTCSPLLEGIPQPASVETSSGEELSLSITGLYPGVPYNCSVVTATSEGQSQPASKVQATEETAPTGPPLSVDVVVGVNDVTFTWSLPQVTLRNGEITGFTLSCFSGGSLMLRQSFTGPGTYTVAGFSSNTAYTCSVMASNSKGDGPPVTLELTTQTEDSTSSFNLVPVVAGVVAVVFIISMMVILVVVIVCVAKKRRRKYSLNRARPNSYIMRTADSTSATVTANPNTNEGDYSIIKTAVESEPTAPPQYEMIRTYSQLPPGKRPAPDHLQGCIDLTINQHAETNLDIDGGHQLKGGIVLNPQYQMLPSEINGAAATADPALQNPQYEMIDNFSRVGGGGGASENVYEVPKMVGEESPVTGRSRPAPQYSVPQTRHNTISQPHSTRSREDTLSSYSVPRSRNYTVTQGAPLSFYNVPRSQQKTGTSEQQPDPLPQARANPNPYDRLSTPTNATTHDKNRDSAKS